MPFRRNAVLAGYATGVGLGLENIGVYAIVYECNTCVLEERLPYLALKPSAYGDKCHVGYRQEASLLQVVVACRPVEDKAFGVGSLLGTLSAARFPLVAPHIHIMCAVARIRPAVVHGPHHRLAAAGKVAEQYGIVEVIAVDVVQVYHIGVETLGILNKLVCGVPRHQSLIVENARAHAVYALVCHAAYMIKLGAAWV